MVPSSQISGLISAQQVMFANQAAMAHQISGIVSGGPVMTPGLQNPFPATPIGNTYGLAGYAGQSLGGIPIPGGQQYGGFGAYAAGGLGMAVPTALTGASLMGGLIGGSAGWLDPFTASARAFRMGSGAAAGSGVMATFGHIGSAFRAGGMAAGMSAVGGGLGAAAVTAAPYYAAFKAAEVVGSNMWAGAQNIGQVGQMAQEHFGPAFGTGSMRPGGQWSRGAVRDVVGVLHEIANDDVMVTIRDAKQMMDKAGQMGMLTGVRDVSEFRRRLKDVVSQVKSVAAVLGTTLEEAAPVFQQMHKMGIVSARDILGTSMAMRLVGPQGAEGLLNVMGQGAQVSSQLGGRLSAGAQAGRQAFLQIQSAMNLGVLRPGDITELTGGLSGAEGQQAAAGKMLMAMQQLMKTGPGQLMIAGLGEVKGDSFTGRVDENKLRQFMASGLSVDDLKAAGRKAGGTREGGVSFMNQKDIIAQELLGQGGLGVGSRILEGILDKVPGGSSPEVQKRLIQQLTGMNARDADAMKRLMDELPRIMEERNRRELSAIDDARQRIDIRRNRSWEGLRDAVSKSFERGVESPIQRFAENLTTSWNESTDRLSDALWDRVRNLEVSQVERMKILQRDVTQRLYTSEAGLLQGDMRTSMAERWRMGSFRGTRMANLLGTEDLRMGGTAGPGEVQLGFATSIVAARSGGIHELKLNEDYQAVFASQDAVNRMASTAQKRASATSLQDLGMSPSATASRAVDRLHGIYQSMLLDPTKATQLRVLKGKLSPGRYIEELGNMLGAQPGADTAFANASRAGASVDDLVAILSNRTQGDLAGAFGDLASGVSWLSLQRDARGATEAIEGMGEAIRLGQRGLRADVKGGTLLDRKLKSIGAMLDKDYLEVSDTELRTALSGSWGSALEQFIQGDTSPDNEFYVAATRDNDPLAQRIMAGVQYQQFKGGVDFGRIQAGARGSMAIKLNRTLKDVAAERRGLAGQELGALHMHSAKSLGGASIHRQYQAALEAMEKTSPDALDGSLPALRELANRLSGNKGARDAFLNMGFGGSAVAGLAGGLGELQATFGGAASLKGDNLNRMLGVISAARGGGNVLDEMRLANREGFNTIQGMLSNDVIDRHEMVKAQDILRKFLESQGPKTQVDVAKEKLQMEIQAFDSIKRLVEAIGREFPKLKDSERFNTPAGVEKPN